MPHIELPEGLPGISAGFAFRPETAKPMRELAHVLLHQPSTLSAGERELIATYVSARNDCHFCQSSHAAAAACHLGDGSVVEKVKADFRRRAGERQTQGPAGDCRQSAEGWQAGDDGRCRRRAQAQAQRTLKSTIRC